MDAASSSDEPRMFHDRFIDAVLLSPGQRVRFFLFIIFQSKRNDVGQQHETCRPGRRPVSRRPVNPDVAAVHQSQPGRSSGPRSRLLHRHVLLVRGCVHRRRPFHGRHRDHHFAGERNQSQETQRRRTDRRRTRLERNGGQFESHGSWIIGTGDSAVHHRSLCQKFRSRRSRSGNNRRFGGIQSLHDHRPVRLRHP